MTVSILLTAESSVKQIVPTGREPAPGLRKVQQQTDLLRESRPERSYNRAMTEDPYRRAAQVLKQSEAIVITAGAGIGVDSGLPDFRGNEGFWRAYPPIAKLGLTFAEMANPEWFDTDPDLAWGFYGHRLNLYRRTMPHDGFKMLLNIARSKALGYFVFTSNVDGQFQKAGFAPRRIVECHGSIHYLQCSHPCRHTIWEAGETIIKVDESVFRATSSLPRCEACGRMARPNILMFGDWSWLGARTADQRQRMNHWFDEIREKSASMAVIETGAGTAVPTVRLESERLARNPGSTLIRLNPREAQVPGPGRVNISINDSCLAGLRKIVSIYETL